MSDEPPTGVDTLELARDICDGRLASTPVVMQLAQAVVAQAAERDRYRSALEERTVTVAKQASALEEENYRRVCAEAELDRCLLRVQELERERAMDAVALEVAGESIVALREERGPHE